MYPINQVKGAHFVSPVRSAMLMKTFFRGEYGIDENIAFFKNLPKRETVFPEGSEDAGTVSGRYKQMIDDPLKALYWKRLPVYLSHCDLTVNVSGDAKSVAKSSASCGVIFSPGAKLITECIY